MDVAAKESTQPSDSFLNRAAGIFISPGQAFESIVRKPNFLTPLVVMVASSAILVEAMLEKVGAERIIQRSLELSGKAANMTPEQLAQAVHRAAPITAISMRVFNIVGVPMFLLIIAATGLFIVNVIFGASTDFKACFSVVCYANLVLIVDVVLGLLMIFLGDVEQFNPQAFVPTTVGFFLNPQEVSKPLYVIASSFDIIQVWFIILTSLGLSIATNKKVGAVTIFLIYLGIWIVLVLGRAGIVALMG